MRSAVLVIDVQNEYFTGRMPVTYPSGSLNNILNIMDEAYKRHIPVVLIQHTAPQADSKTFVRGTNEWEIHEEVLKKNYDIVIEKNFPDSFVGTKLEGWLRERGIDTVTVCGYMTQMCCDTTARHAMHLGFNVEFLSDATGTLQISNYAGTVSAEELHKAILVTQAMRFSKVMSSGEWIKSKL